MENKLEKYVIVTLVVLAAVGAVFTTAINAQAMPASLQGFLQSALGIKQPQPQIKTKTTAQQIKTVVQYRVCNSAKQCVSVNGVGNHECLTAADCQTAPLRHMVCNNSKQCVSVAGRGSNQCATNANCGGK